MSEKTDRQIDDLQIGRLMEQFGFNPKAPTATARALILNLVRSAYGPDAAREFMRQMNLDKNRYLEPSVVMEEFNKNRLDSGVGTEETQLSLFSSPTDEQLAHVGDEVPGTLLQKKSRRA